MTARGWSGAGTGTVAGTGWVREPCFVFMGRQDNERSEWNN